jgi:ELWxxDGT repeat protein
MLADLSSGTSGADIYYGFTEFQGSLYFRANDGVNGNELWKVNPTTGLTMVKDIRPGSAGSNSNLIWVVGNSMYFQADDGTNGYEMWRSDGTNIGTYMVANLNPGTGDSYPKCYTDFGNDKILFQANDGTHGNELWIYNSSLPASTTNPHMVVDLRAGSDSSSPCGYETDSFATRNGVAVITPYTSTYGREIWITDGTSQGTHLHTDLNPGTNSGFYYGFCGDPEDLIFGNKLYFNTGGGELFTYDFADNTTTAIGSGVSNDCMMTYDPLYLEEFDGQIYFGANNGNDGNELHRYNPVDNIMQMVGDYNPTGDGVYTYSMGTIIAYDDTLIWRCTNYSHNSELCRLGTSTDITYSE